MYTAHVDEFYTAYLDGSLDERARRQVETHLDACPSCLAGLEEMRLLVAALGEMDDLPLPAGFTAGVRARLTPRPARRWFSDWRVPTFAGGALAAALALLLVVTFLTPANHRGAPSTGMRADRGTVPPAPLVGPSPQTVTPPRKPATASEPFAPGPAGDRRPASGMPPVVAMAPKPAIPAPAPHAGGDARARPAAVAAGEAPIVVALAPPPMLTMARSGVAGGAIAFDDVPPSHFSVESVRPEGDSRPEGLPGSSAAPGIAPAPPAAGKVNDGAASPVTNETVVGAMAAGAVMKSMTGRNDQQPATATLGATAATMLAFADKDGAREADALLLLTPSKKRAFTNRLAPDATVTGQAGAGRNAAGALHDAFLRVSGRASGPLEIRYVEPMAADAQRVTLPRTPANVCLLLPPLKDGVALRLTLGGAGHASFYLVLPARRDARGPLALSLDRRPRLAALRAISTAGALAILCPASFGDGTATLRWTAIAPREALGHLADEGGCRISGEGAQVNLLPR